MRNKPAQGDLLVVKQEGKTKNKLVRVVNPDGDPLVVRVEGSKAKNQRTTEECKIDLVVINLGNYLEVPYGTVYNCLVEPFLSSTDTDWGPLHYYRKLEEDEKAKLKKALHRCWTKLKEAKLTGFAPITLELRHKKGSIAGSYSVPKDDSLSDIMTIRPESFLREDLDYVVFHEAGHGIAFNLMPSQLQLRWIKLYTYYTKLSALDSKELSQIRKTLEQTGEFKQVDKDHLDACLATVKANYGIRRHDLEIMLEHNESLEEIWPTHSLDLTDSDVPISDYATKNVDEMWAEAFAFYMVGKPLPKRVKRLVEETLAACRGKTK